jgi:hypothetical protein
MIINIEIAQRANDHSRNINIVKDSDSERQKSNLRDKYVVVPTNNGPQQCRFYV